MLLNCATFSLRVLVKTKKSCNKSNRARFQLEQLIDEDIITLPIANKN
jgi:hypothetical protein